MPPLNWAGAPLAGQAEVVGASPPDVDSCQWDRSHRDTPPRRPDRQARVCRGLVGALCVRLTDGDVVARLNIRPTSPQSSRTTDAILPEYEAYTLILNNGAMYVCMAAGELAVWDAST